LGMATETGNTQCGEYECFFHQVKCME
jgi:hypothetical protein